MDQAITALGKNGFQGVYAANDGTAGGAIAAMKGSGHRPAHPPTTGQDAELAAIQRILAGEQYMTVYKADQARGRGGRDSSPWRCVKGKTCRAGADQRPGGQRDRGGSQSIILDPVAVTKDNIKDTVIKDGYWTPPQICTGPYEAACKAAGIQ